MSASPLLSIEAQIAHSILLDKAAKRVGITLEQARALCAVLAEHSIRDVEQVILGAYDHHVRRTNRETRRSEPR